MRTVILSILILLFFNGCSVFNGLISIEDSIVIRKLAKNGTYLALMTIYEDDEIEKRIKIAKILKDDIATNIINISSNEAITIDGKVFDKIITNIPKRIRPFLYSAIDIIMIAKIDIGETAEKYPIVLIKEFCYGICDGCTKVLEMKNVVDENSGKTT